MSPQFPCRTKGQRSTPEESKAGFLLLPLPSELLPEGVLEPSLLARQAGALLCHVTDPVHSVAGLRADGGGRATVGMRGAREGWLHSRPMCTGHLTSFSLVPSEPGQFLLLLVCLTTGRVS